MNMGKNGEWKNSLDRFLKFYRENRELIAMVAGGMGAKRRFERFGRIFKGARRLIGKRLHDGLQQDIPLARDKGRGDRFCPVRFGNALAVNTLSVWPENFGNGKL